MLTDACEKHGISPHLILPHGSYLMNLGSTDETTLSKSRAVLLDEVQRCDRLGLLYYNIHPGLNNKVKNLEALTTVHFFKDRHAEREPERKASGG